MKILDYFEKHDRNIFFPFFLQPIIIELCTSSQKLFREKTNTFSINIYYIYFESEL